MNVRLPNVLSVLLIYVTRRTLMDKTQLNVACGTSTKIKIPKTLFSETQFFQALRASPRCDTTYLTQNGSCTSFLELIHPIVDRK